MATAKKQSAGILLYRLTNGFAEVLLVHPGGPFWVKKDEGAWSVPKGELNDGEDGLVCARREFYEETGFAVEGNFIALAPVKLKSGKQVLAWALEQDIDAAAIVSNTFEMEWPPKSGRMQSFPEVDKGAWFNLDDARRKMNVQQAALIDEFEEILLKP